MMSAYEKLKVRQERKREARKIDYQKHSDKRREARRKRYAERQAECAVCLVPVAQENRKSHENTKRHKYLSTRRAEAECSTACRLCRVLGWHDAVKQIENGEDLWFGEEDDPDQPEYREEGGEELARSRGYCHEYEVLQYKRERVVDDRPLVISDDE